MLPVGVVAPVCKVPISSLVIVLVPTNSVGCLLISFGEPNKSPASILPLAFSAVIFW